MTPEHSALVSEFKTAIADTQRLRGEFKHSFDRSRDETANAVVNLAKCKQLYGDAVKLHEDAVKRLNADRAMDDFLLQSLADLEIQERQLRATLAKITSN